MLPLLAALWLAVSARAGEPPSPGFSLTVKDDIGEGAYRPKFKPWESLTFEPVFKAGALALTESFPYPYPILKQSPFAMAGMKMTFSGPFEAMVTATAGAVRLRSQRLLDDSLELATPATRHAGRDLSQNQLVGSVYADVGKTFDAGGGWKAALYAAANAVGWNSPGANYGSDGLLEGNAGATVMRRDGPHELTLFADVAAEAAPRNGFRNDGNLTAVPSGRAGAEYAVAKGGGRWLAGVEGQTRRADDSVRPYLGIERGDLRALLAVEMRRGKDPFFPDQTAVAARVQGRVARDLTAGVTGRYESKRYDLAPGALNDGRVMVDLTWTPGGEKLAVHSAKQWAASHKEEYSGSRQRELNAAALASPESAEVRALIAASPTLPEFLAAYRPGSSQGILTALSEFTSLFSRYNYNYREGDPPNLDSIAEIYARMRGSYLSGSADPTLVCLGAAQSAAALAVELGRRSGIPIEASATSVKTADEQGRSGGHAVAQVRTKDMGIVFVDWGRIIPTYTYDTERSLRVYQALVGVPAVYHQVTDPTKGGRHVAYLFTEEGRLYVNALTFHGESGRSPASNLMNDDPRGDQITTERYKNLLRRP